MTSFFGDGQEFNRKLAALQETQEAFRFMERSSGAYEEAIDNMQHAFNAFLGVVEARRRYILGKEKQ